MTDEAALRDVLGRIGPIVGLVNNAGMHTEARSTELSIADLEASFRINVTAVFAACREAQPHLVAAGGGLIVNIGSFFDRMGVPRSLAYCAAKAAVGAMTRCLAVEWARFDIRVMDVAPGYIETDLNHDALQEPRMQEYIRRRVPARRAGTPEEVARLVGALFETEIGYLTGETIYMDGATRDRPPMNQPLKIFDRLDRRRHWSEEEVMVLDQVRRLCAEEIAPRAAAYDRSGEFPWDNVRALNALGMNAIFIPEQYGGAPMRYRLYLECVRDISEACASTGIIYATNFHGMKPVIDMGSDALRHRVLPRVAAGALGALAITEASAGSDATQMRTQFCEDGDDIVVTGDKVFISNGDVADFLLVFGKWDGIDDPKAAISCLVMERNSPGFELIRLEEKMGHRAASTAAIAFDGVRVPRGQHDRGTRRWLEACCSRRSTNPAPRSPPMRSASPTPRSATWSPT